MICSACGAETPEGVRFCKHCGANLNASFASPRRFPTGVFIAFLLVFGIITMAGFGIPLAAASEMMHGGVGPNFALQIFAIGATATVVVDAMLVWLLLRLLKMYQPAARHLPTDAGQRAREVIVRQL